MDGFEIPLVGIHAPTAHHRGARQNTEEESAGLLYSSSPWNRQNGWNERHCWFRQHCWFRPRHRIRRWLAGIALVHVGLYLVWRHVLLVGSFWCGLLDPLDRPHWIGPRRLRSKAVPQVRISPKRNTPPTNGNAAGGGTSLRRKGFGMSERIYERQAATVRQISCTRRKTLEKSAKGTIFGPSLGL